jgi:hypothetical protein
MRPNPSVADAVGATPKETDAMTTCRTPHHCALSFVARAHCPEHAAPPSAAREGEAIYRACPMAVGNDWGVFEDFADDEAGRPLARCATQAWAERIAAALNADAGRPRHGTGRHA